MGGTTSISAPTQDDLYREAVDQFSSSLERLVNAYEVDPEKRRDLSQEIHFQLWRSLQKFDARCSLRTWTYRVAHNVGASHIIRERRVYSTLVSLEEIELAPAKSSSLSELDRCLNLDRLGSLIQGLKPLDRQIIVSYLEDLDAATIGEITGLSPTNVAMRIHRIKNILTKQFHQGGHNSE